MRFSDSFCKIIWLSLVGIILASCGGGGGGASSPSTSTSNAAPVASAIPIQNVITGTLVTLNGSASYDANGDPLTYSWTLTSKPASSTATMSGTTSATPTFTADLAGTYVASLVVNDGKVNSTAATVTVTASVANAAPVANAGTAQNVVTGSLITLNGSLSSDANGDPLTYSWTLTSKPASSTAAMTGSTSAAPTFTADLAGTYVASLVVNDGKVSSISTSVTITAIVGNAAPIANAGADQNVTTGTLVTLNGSASSDANGDPLTYSWTLSDSIKPIGSTATLTGATTAYPTFTTDLPGAYAAWLIVNDGKVNSTTTYVIIWATTPSGATSKTYNITVTRTAQDYYLLSGYADILQTKFCYEYATSDAAVLVMNASTGVSDGTITFSNGQTCTVAGAYYPMSLIAGSYLATLTLDDLPFYKASFQNVIIRASSSCFAYRYSDNSSLSLTYGGLAYSSGLKIGTITFSDSSTCDLIGVYGLSVLN